MTRMVGRFIWHYIEMVIAMIAGMLLLAPIWSALPGIDRIDVDTLTMAADMTVGMAAWMKIRGHGWAGIAEMSGAMLAPFVLLLVPYWFGALPGHLVMPVGHTLMFVAMALAMLRRREEYLLHHRHRHQHRLGIRPRWIWRAAVVLFALLIPASVAGANTAGKFAAIYKPRADTTSARPGHLSADHDPSKPTVAFLVGGKGANAADLLGPYEVLASTGRFNTYVVSAGSQPAPLSGGLDLVPDLTFDEMTRLLGARHDKLDAIVVPALQTPAPAESASIQNWLRRQSSDGTLIVSVCNGARTLAAGGLLDGRAATSHWLRLPGLRADFAEVDWVSGMRYVDSGNVITTAGVLSGIDGGLRIIERFFDTGTAREAAANVHWRHYTPGAAAPIPTSGWEASDAVVALNASFQTRPSAIGVRLFDGVGELELASAFVSYTEQSMIGRTVALGDGPIRSKHGLTFVPRSTVAAAAGHLDRLLVPGLDAARGRVAGTGPSAATGGLQPVYLHTAEEFAFDPVIRDIARTYDVQTARWTAKTLEYPVMDVELTGGSWPWRETILGLALTVLGAAAAIGAGAIFRRIRSTPGVPLPDDRPIPAHAH